MGEVRIANGVLEAAVSVLGAELGSLRRLDTGIEVLWQGDAASWPRRAPVLFPIVGKLRGDRYLWRGVEYRLPQHGFARDSVFEIAASDATSATFVLVDDDQTRQVFPFPFRLAVSYRLEGAVLEISIDVSNPEPDDLLFSVGGHPGFRCPLLPGERFEDYSLVFQHAETVGRWPVVDGLIDTPPEMLLTAQHELPLSRDLFSRGALVFKDLRSTRVRLANRRSGTGVEMSLDGFPFFGVWSKPPGDFVCLEPWCGIADPVDATGRLEEKEGILRVGPHATFRRSFQLHILGLAALADPEAEIRIEAARRLGPRGIEKLRDLAASPETPGPLAARAVTLLGDELPEPTAILLLRTTNTARSMSLGKTLVEHLARRPSPAALAELRRLLAEAATELAAVVARSLALAGPSAEAILQPTLADPRPEVRLAAAASLAQVGSIDSVSLLRLAAEGSSLDRAFVRAAGQAVAAIQARTGGSPGQLALSETSGGAVSLAPAPTGSLSPAEE